MQPYNYSDIDAELSYDVRIRCNHTYRGTYKLFVIFNYFLSRCRQLGITKIIFISACPFTYGLDLVSAYSEMKFILFDSRHICVPGIDEVQSESDITFAHNNIVHVCKDFDDDSCHYFDSSYALFSDRRKISGDDAEVISDNEKMFNWVTTFRPKLYGLKFRCPYNVKSSFKYLGGTFYIQPYCNPTSSETRLIGCPDDTLQDVDPTTYASKMFYYNVRLRSKLERTIVRAMLDGLQDCRLSLEIKSNLRRCR